MGSRFGVQPSGGFGLEHAEARTPTGCDLRFTTGAISCIVAGTENNFKIMATKTIIKPAKSPTAVGPYNHAVRVGDLMFCAGQIPIDPKDGNLINGDIKAQTERVLENVKAILEDQKLTFANVVKSTVFLTNLGDFAGMNEIYAKYFTGDFPARSTIQVAALPKGASVEIEVIAHF
jgi:2-iminobutanoate/2-iminopropanoate deaminase